MSNESLDIGIGVRRKPREDWNLQAFETLNLTNQDVICVSSTVLTSEKEIVNEKGKDSNKSTGQKKDVTCVSSTVLTIEKEIVNEKGKDSNKSTGPKKDVICVSSTVLTSEKEIVNEKGKDSNKSTGQKKDVTCVRSTVLTIEKEIVNEKDKDSNKSTGPKKDITCASATVLTSEKEIVNEKGKDSNKSEGQKKDVTCVSSTVLTIKKEIVNEKGKDSNKSTGPKKGNEKKIWKTHSPLRSKQDQNPRSITDKTYAMYEFFITEKVKIMLKRVFGVIGVALIVLAWFGLLSSQTTKTRDANELNVPRYRGREKRDSSSVDWKIVNPVLKIGAPLCISFQVKAPQCTVHFDNKTIGSDADQYGSIRVHANGKNCILCIHNFHLVNHTINRPIQVDSGLDRIATTSLQDILTEDGLVVYGTVIHEDNKVELIFSQIGQQANCFYEDNSKINVTAGRIQLIYDHNQTVNLTHKRILFDRCISFHVDCTVRKMNYFLVIPQCPLKKNLPVILGVSIAVLVLLVVIIIAVIYWRRRSKNSSLNRSVGGENLFNITWTVAAISS